MPSDSNVTRRIDQMLLLLGRRPKLPLSSANVFLVSCVSPRQVYATPHCQQVLRKVIWKERVATRPQVGECTLPLCVLAVQCATLWNHYGSVTERYRAITERCGALRNITEHCGTLRNVTEALRIVT